VPFSQVVAERLLLAVSYLFPSSNFQTLPVSVLEDIFENVQIGPRASAVALVRTVQQKERGILAIGDQGL
jgi:hypothetical protein